MGTFGYESVMQKTILAFIVITWNHTLYINRPISGINVGLENLAPPNIPDLTSTHLSG